MNTGKNRFLAALAAGALGFSGMVLAQSAKPAVTLDQAVIKVQQETGGKVLSAEPHRLGRRLEYRIKVLTPEGHVRVITVSSEASKKAVSTQSTKTSANKAGDSKEKH